MKSAHPLSPAQPRISIRRERLFLPLLLASLLLLVTILASFHHHHDLADHPDCAVCAFVHHPDATAPASPVPVATILPILPVLFVLPVLTIPAARSASLLRSRAPPR